MNVTNMLIDTERTKLESSNIQLQTSTMQWLIFICF